MVDPRPERAVEYHVRDALRMLDRIGDGNRTAARDTEQWKALEPRGIDDRFEIVYPQIEAAVIHVALRHAIAALVVPDQPMMTRQLAVPVAPDGTTPFEVEMREPVRRLHERWSVAGAGVAEPDTVARRAVPDFLPRLRRRRP